VELNCALGLVDSKQLFESLSMPADHLGSGLRLCALLLTPAYADLCLLELIVRTALPGGVTHHQEPTKSLQSLILSSGRNKYTGAHRPSGDSTRLPKTCREAL
jgi:hypothetical protein